MVEKENRFEELVLKYLSKEISDNELEELKNYLKSGSKFRSYFDKENEIWQIANLDTDATYVTDRGWGSLKDKLEINDRKSSIIVLSKRKLAIILAAACIIIFAGISLIFENLQNSGIETEVAKSSIEIRTEEGEKASIILPDSTRILLNSGTCLTYDNDYNQEERTVRLSGEAYFEVKTNPEKPFVVQLDSIFITATGTRFNIYSYKNDDRIETTLTEGHINVTTKSGNRMLDLDPGQQAVYYSNSGKTVVRNVITETYTSWKENKLRLIDTPIEEALRKIARRYNVVFEIQGLNLLELKYTATFIDESIEEVMQMLGTVSPISYRIYNRTSVNDKQYLKPKIVIWPKKRN